MRYRIVKVGSESRTDIYNILEPDKVRLNDVAIIVKQDKQRLNKELDYIFAHSEHKIHLLYDNDVPIGITISNHKDKDPWLGAMTILKDHRMTKAPILLADFILNVLYPGERVYLGRDYKVNKDFENLITNKRYSRISYFKDGMADRLDKALGRTQYEYIGVTDG